MATSKMTILGMYNYDNTLFDNLTFPTGIDKSTAVDEILRRSGEFESLYADAGFVKFLIGKWGLKHARTFEKWHAVLSEEYDPLYNYDGHEEIRDEDRRSLGKSHDVTNTSSGSHDATNTTTNMTTENSRSAYDSAAYSPVEKDVTNGSVRDAGVTSGSNRDAGTENETESKTLIHTMHRYGNQGTTMSQQMLQAELDVQRWNLYENIADIFIDEFCIMIY